MNSAFDPTIHTALQLARAIQQGISILDTDGALRWLAEFQAKRMAYLALVIGRVPRVARLGRHSAQRVHRVGRGIHFWNKGTESERSRLGCLLSRRVWA